MRQAYDYWQDQPDNYRGPSGGRPSTSRGGKKDPPPLEPCHVFALATYDSAHHTPGTLGISLSLSAWPAGPSPPWMEGEGSLSSPPGTRSNRTPFVSLVAGDELCRTAGHWLAAGRDCPKRLSPPSPFELLGCMQEALSDHHSRASTSLQVPKKKGGLLRMGR